MASADSRATILTKPAYLVIFLFNVSLATDKWIWKNPIPQGNRLNSVHFQGSSGIAVGNLGTIVKSNDSGHTWNLVESGTQVDFKSVRLIDSQFGYAVAKDSILRVTENGGGKWISLPVLGIRWFQCAYFVDKNRGHAFGMVFSDSSQGITSKGQPLRTVDGGRTWIFGSSSQSMLIHTMHFFNPDTGIALGESGLFKTVDAGLNWLQVRSPSPPYMTAMHFPGQRIGYGINETGTVYLTHGGDVWSVVGEADVVKASSVRFIDEQTGFISGRTGSSAVIYKTSDGGSTWVLNQQGEGSWFDLHFTDRRSGYAVGAGGAILRTSNGGQEWTYRSKGYAGTLFKVWFSNTSRGFAVGESGAIFNTINGGENWDTLLTEGRRNLYDLHFPAFSVGYAIGDSGTVLKSVDSGVSWKRLEVGTTRNLHAVKFIDVDVGYAVGEAGWMLKTLDGGKTWTSRHMGTSGDLNSIWLVDSKQGYIVGNGGLVLKTTDGGLTWQSRNYLANEKLESVYFSNAESGMAVTQSGVIKTADGGTTWSYVLAGNDLGHDIAFPSSSTGYFVGRSGLISKTIDGGQSWESQTSEAELEFYSVHCPDEKTCFAVGEGAAIKKLVVSPVSIAWPRVDNKPGKVGKLTSDGISYMISNASPVRVLLLDTRGKTVSQLFNGVQPPGIHVISVPSGTRLSGLHLVSLQIREQREVFKLIQP